MLRLFFLLILTCTCFLNTVWADDVIVLKANKADQVWRIDAPTVKNKNAVSLGKTLFFDPRLLGQDNQSCATCHYPGFSWSKGRSFQQKVPVQWLSRQVPSLLNVYAYQHFFWDGRVDAPLQAAISAHLKGLVARGMQYRSQAFEWTYKKMFMQAFGENDISPIQISYALAAYVRTIHSKDTLFDRWLAGDKKSMSAPAVAGFRLFKGKAGCVRCHSPPYFTDSAIHNIGMESLDPGYYDISKRKQHYNAFRTPMLRQVPRTSPYMHNGSFASLRDVILFYNKGGDLKGGGNDLVPLNLSPIEQDQLLAFLNALQGEETQATIPALPMRSNYLLHVPK
ncbi:MAG: cytochrome c peroxidase [Mariprofundaceae bacterium]|nr:cytochrome c peroxidase [Mariprofundaceae bacterium]